MKLQNLLFFICLLPGISHTQSNINLRLAAEGGLQNTNQWDMVQLARFQTNLKAKAAWKNGSVTTKGMANYIFLPFYNNHSENRIKGELFILQKMGPIQFTGFFNFKNDSYSENQKNRIGYRIAGGGTQAQWYYSRENAIRICVERYSSELEPVNRSQGFIYYLIHILWISKTSAIHSGLNYDIYTLNQYCKPVLPNENNGFAGGIHFSYNYRSNFILKADYQARLRGSALNSYLEPEHWIKLVWGKIYQNKWALFIYLDYFYKPKNKRNLEYPLNPIPLNNENRFYLKVSRIVNKKWNYYLKIMWLSNDIFDHPAFIQGWQGLIGLDFDLI